MRTQGCGGIVFDLLRCCTASVGSLLSAFLG